MKTFVAAVAAALLALASIVPAVASPLDDFAGTINGWINSLPGSHVGHLSLTDHADVPNCTVLGPNVAGCETVLVFPKSGSHGSRSSK